jgi:hypothetical protein
MNDYITYEEQGTEKTSKPCPFCEETVIAGDAFCQHCGYPLKGTEEEQNTFRTERLLKEGKLVDIDTKVRTASIIMYVLAGLYLLFGIVTFPFVAEEDSPGAVLLINLIVSGLYAGLGYWCRAQPVPAIISGLILYAVVTVLNAVIDPSTLLKGIIIKIFIIAFLIKGLISAYEAQRIKKELHIV